MTTAASFTSLHAPLAEDSMEMSSPAQPVYDDDIDIDFEEHVGGVELTDDERMVDDIEQPRPGTATDDMMEDDAPSQDAQAPEQEMQDDFDAVAYEQADPDDELIDYGEDDYQEMGEGNDQTVFEPPAPEITLEDREPTDPGFEQVDDEIIREPETSMPVPEVVVAEETILEAAPAIPDTNATEASIIPHAETTSEDAPNDTTEQQAVAPEENAVGDVATAVGGQDDEVNSPATPHDVEPFPELPEDSPELKEAAPIPAPLDTNLDTSVDAPSTPTDTGLHPMVIQYGDWEWPLFKSRKQPDGLLKDDNLASVALADLFNNCRSRLALKVGEDISEDQEFVLRFDSTGLTIIENSPSAFNTSLDEILEVFKQLHINDGAQSIPPFWLYLSLQPKPSSYLTMLKQAAAGGQGISSFVDVPAEEVPADFGDYYQDGDQDPTLLGDASGIDYDDQPHNDGQDVAADADLNEANNYHEYDTSYENTEGGQEAQEGYEQYEQYDETEQAEYEEYGEGEHGEETDKTAANFEHTDNVQPSEDTAESFRTDVEDTTAVSNGETEHTAAELAPETVDETAANAGEGEGEEQGEGSNVESVASSTTLRADQANDAVGEYKDEDLIDWDDSTLTSDHSEHATDDNEDFSTFLTEPDLEETEPQATTGNDATYEGGDRHDDTTIQEAAGHEHDLEQDDGHETASNVAESKPVVDDVLQSRDEVEEQNNSLGPTETSAGEVVGTDDRETNPSDNADKHVGQAQDQTAGHSASMQDTLQTPEVGAEHQGEKPISKEPARNDEDFIDFGDEDGIDFDDDTYEQHEARKASQANSPDSQSPTSKRPLDEADGIDFTEQPDLKKVKSS